MIWQEVAAGVVTAAVIGLLGAIYREVRLIRSLPIRIERVEREMRKAHGDLWDELTQIAETVNEHVRRFH